MLKWLVKRIRNIYWLRRLSWRIIGKPHMYLLATHEKCGSRAVAIGTKTGEITCDCFVCNALVPLQSLSFRIVSEEELETLPEDSSEFPDSSVFRCCVY